MKIKGYKFPEDLYYDKNHFWAQVEGDMVTMGATDFTAQLAGEITFIELPEEGDELSQGKPFGSIESGKWVGRVYAVVSGEVMEVNDELEDEPEKVNQDPYQAWICRIKVCDLESELENLLKPADMEEFIETEIKRVNS